MLREIDVTLEKGIRDNRGFCEWEYDQYHGYYETGCDIGKEELDKAIKEYRDK